MKKTFITALIFYTCNSLSNSQRPSEPDKALRKCSLKDLKQFMKLPRREQTELNTLQKRTSSQAGSKKNESTEPEAVINVKRKKIDISEQ
jgi:hypothetical protein